MEALTGAKDHEQSTTETLSRSLAIRPDFAGRLTLLCQTPDSENVSVNTFGIEYKLSQEGQNQDAILCETWREFRSTL